METSDMITTTDLRELSQELADSRVLSVYLDTHLNDPALRFTGRAVVAAALRVARAQTDDDADRLLFDRAALAIYQELPPPDDLRGAPGWAAFVTAEGVRHVGWLPVRPTSFAAWRDGPVIAPYLRALEEQRPVVVALVDSRSARLYRYVAGRLEAIETLAPSFEELLGGERAPTSSRVGRSVPAPRGAVATEAAERRRRSAFQRLTSVLSPRLAQLAGVEGWILIGGTPEWSRLAGEALAPQLCERLLLSSSLGLTATDEEIAREAKRAASALRSVHGRRLLAEVLEASGARGRAAIGGIAARLRFVVTELPLIVAGPFGLRAGRHDRPVCA
jgi:hypothetical protein